MVKDDEFFRKATLLICGSLDIEKALWDCFEYLSNFIPAKEAYIFYRPSNPRDTFLYAMADHRNGRLINQNIPVHKEAKALLDNDAYPKKRLINRADKDMVFMQVFKALGKTKISALYMRLIIDEKIFGSLVLLADGWDRFNKEHMRQLGLLEQPFAVALVNSRRYKELLELKERLADNNLFLQNELRSVYEDEVIGADFGLKTVMDLVRHVAPRGSLVLLQGETGVGKEVIATAVHNMSKRRNGPFIKVNCGSIPETLIDSELFGHEKGAFTGAFQKTRGRFERADGGTLFLDEIGELPPKAQVRLLRVLQEKQVERVGGSTSIKIDVRVIVATHRDLWRMVEEGGFREDLLYRISVFPIEIPPLRERKSDIPDLVQYFIEKKSHEMGLDAVPPLGPGELDGLLDYSWPGNVRELENAVERALILRGSGNLTFPGTVDRQIRGPDSGFGDQKKGSLMLDEVVAGHIVNVLARTKGRVGGPWGAARLLGVNASTLRHKMRKLKIPFGRRTRINQKGRGPGSTQNPETDRQND